jgi:hypothetical protein
MPEFREAKVSGIQSRATAGDKCAGYRFGADVLSGA